MIGHGIFGFGGLFTMILFWLALAVALFFVIRGMYGESSSTYGHGFTPHEVLQRRYAAGEIGRDEYERILKDLKR